MGTCVKELASRAAFPSYKGISSGLVPQMPPSPGAQPSPPPRSCCALQRVWGCGVNAQSSAAACGGHCCGAMPDWAALGRGQQGRREVKGSGESLGGAVVGWKVPRREKYQCRVCSVWPRRVRTHTGVLSFRARACGNHERHAGVGERRSLVCAFGVDRLQRWLRAFVTPSISH